MKRFDAIRAGAFVLALGGVLSLWACDAVDELLVVDNPETIQPGELSDPRLIEVLANSPPGELQDMYDEDIIWRGTMLTDEVVQGINWEQTARLSRRIIRYDEGDAEDMFESIHQLRMISDTVAARLRELVENPAASPELAQTLAYDGYSYVLAGEMLCESTFDVGAEIFQPPEIFGFAIPYFDEAISIATAAGREDIANLARVGAARAYLSMGGHEDDVMRYASEVPRDFVWWAYYELNSGENTLYGETHGGNHNLGVHPDFLNGEFLDHDIVETQTDPRIQHTTDWSTGHNGLTPLYSPFQGLRFSGYNGQTIADGGQPAEFQRDTDVKLASGLEALHHYYEAAGPSGTGPAGTTLEFVNARRAFGNQPPVDLSGDALMAELREQRGKDFYLGGLRLGDLRRWVREGIGTEDEIFPSGPHVNEQWGNYGEATCFPLPLDEYEGNPNVENPNG